MTDIIIYTHVITTIASDDYTPVNATLTFTAGQTFASVQVRIINDTIVEPDETLSVGIFIDAPFDNLASAGDPDQAIITIVDNNGEHNTRLLYGNISVILGLPFCSYCL